MSDPYEIIKCLTCDYQATSLKKVGSFFWKSGLSEIRMETDLGLCRNCCGVVAMEKFPNSLVFAKALGRRSSYWRRCFQLFGKDEPGSLAARKGFLVLAEVMSMLRRPVCLSCGQADVDQLHLPKGGSQDTTTRELSVLHPCCGGPLVIRGSGMNRMAPIRRVCEYDTEGQLIAERHSSSA